MVKNITILLLFSLVLGCGRKRPPSDDEAPQVVDGKVILEVNDAGETVSIPEEEYERLSGEDYHKNLNQFLDFKMSWDTVAGFISPEMEMSYDAFIIVNVDYEDRFDPKHEIPAQHMKVIERTKKGEKLFRRKEGRVVGLQKNIAGNGRGVALGKTYRGVEGAVTGTGILSDLMPVSSGAKHFKVDKHGFAYSDTPSGIYRINYDRSHNRRRSKHPVYKNVTVMWHSLYFDLIYPSGKESGLAIHGTNEGVYEYLGSQRSHGCVRIRQDQANVLYENFINNPQWQASDLPDMDNRFRLKSENDKTKRGPAVLIIIFYGYDQDRESFDI